jgi:hypothetical protein
MIKKLTWLFKFGCPFFTILFPVIGVYGALNPCEWADKALTQYDYRLKILVGTKNTASLYGNEEIARSNSRSYLIFPQKIEDFKIVDVSKFSHNTQPNKVYTEESKLGGYTVLLSYLFFLFGTWWYWIRPKHKSSD